jgi:hypothetical protein
VKEELKQSEDHDRSYVQEGCEAEALPKQDRPSHSEEAENCDNGPADDRELENRCLDKVAPAILGY